VKSAHPPTSRRGVEEIVLQMLEVKGKKSALKLDCKFADADEVVIEEMQRLWWKRLLARYARI
jgi:hypothetical protein